MTPEFWMVHPAFDSLSALVDVDGADVTRSRVGRHVARCERCRGIVAEIRGLGEAVRASAEAVAPAELWSRIDASALRDAPVVARPISPSGNPGATTPVGSPRRARARRPSRRLIAGVGLVAAATIAAVVAWPRRASLEAAGTSRLTFQPTRPVPGGRVTVRYHPAPWMSKTPTLVLVGRMAAGIRGQTSPFGGDVFAALGDSLATLVRAPDGAYVATLTLPRTFLAVGLTVLDVEQDEYDADGVRPWIVIGGTAAREPSYASFVAARDIGPNWFGGSSRLRPRQTVDVADSLKRYFPSHPAGWAYARAASSSRGTFDLFRFFQRGERTYTSMHERLWPVKALDAERLYHMALFARTIQEPGEALRWSARLVDEHPDDPRALESLADAVHDLELREPPEWRDSIRSWLPSLDRAYRAAPVPNHGFQDALRLVMTYGDSSARSLWSGRQAANGTERNVYMVAHSVRTATRRSPAVDDATAVLRERVKARCDLPAGRLPLGESASGWRMRCERYRGMGYAALASGSLRDGDARRGYGESDSALSAMRRGEVCTPSLGYLTRARARLVIGDTTGAASDFVLAAAGYPSTRTTVADTARAALGARFNAARFTAGADSAQRVAASCLAAQRALAKAREGRTRGSALQ